MVSDGRLGPDKLAVAGVRQATPSEELLVNVLKTLDSMLQLQCRIALGWAPAEAIKDMKLNVPLPTPEQATVSGRIKLGQEKEEISMRAYGEDEEK